MDAISFTIASNILWNILLLSFIVSFLGLFMRDINIFTIIKFYEFPLLVFSIIMIAMGIIGLIIVDSSMFMTSGNIRVHVLPIITAILVIIIYFLTIRESKSYYKLIFITSIIIGILFPTLVFLSQGLLPHEFYKGREVEIYVVYPLLLIFGNVFLYALMVKTLSRFEKKPVKQRKSKKLRKKY